MHEEYSKELFETQMKTRIIITISIKYRGFAEKIAPKIVVIKNEEPISMVDIRGMISSGRNPGLLSLLNDISITDSETNNEIDFDFMKLFNMNLFGRSTKTRMEKNRPSYFSFGTIGEREMTRHESLNVMVRHNGKKSIKRMREEDNDYIPEKKLKYATGITLSDANPFDIEDIVKEILSFVRSPVTEWGSKDEFRSAASKNALCTRNINKAFRESYFRGNVKMLNCAWLIRRVDGQYEIIPEMRGLHFDCVDVLLTSIAFMEIILGLHAAKTSIVKYSEIQFNRINMMEVSHQRITKLISTMRSDGYECDCLVKSNSKQSHDVICDFIERHTGQTIKDTHIANVQYEPKGFSEQYSGLFKSCVSEKSLSSGDYNIKTTPVGLGMSYK